MGEKPYFFTPEIRNQNDETRADRVIQKVVDAENFIIDARSAAHNLANLFDTSASKDILYPEVHKYVFMRQYENRPTMFGRLALFLSRDYFDYMNSMDLGKTAEAQNPQIINHMRDQYRRVRAIAETRFGVKELPREASGRTMHFRNDALVTEDIDGTTNVENPLWLIGERNRPLLRLGIDGHNVTVSKRMTFALRSPIAYELADDDGRVRDPEHMADLEEAFDRHDPAIVPIRTLYYVTKSPIK